MSEKKHTSVVIIGGGLTGLSLAAGLDCNDLPFILLEKSDRVGGQIKTLYKDGFTYEVGPNTGTISSPEVVDLFEYASPQAALEVARSESKSRWIWKKDRFHPLPDGLYSGLTTPLFSWGDKFGILLEPFRKRGNNPDETVGELAERRLGRSMVDYAVDPFVGGVYAGDPYQLVTRVALPKLYHLEQNYGSFIRGSVRKAMQPKSEREKKVTKEVFNAVGGLQTLVDAISKKVTRTGEIILETKGVSVRPTPSGKSRFEVTYSTAEGKHIIMCDYVVSTIRGDLIPTVLPVEWGPRLERIRQFPYAPIAVVVVGFKHLPDIPRAAFGALVPSRENRRVLGVLFPSSCFRDRVPYDDGALFTIFVGGLRGKDHFFSVTEEQLRDESIEEFYDLMKIPSDITPDLVHIARYEKGIPQYDRDTEKRHADIKALEEEFPGLYIAGGVRDGIGMAHRITQGMRLAKEIAEKQSNDGR